MSKNKLSILIVSILISAALLFSYLYIAFETNHDCTGEHCEICYEIQMRREFIKKIIFAGSTTLIFGYYLYNIKRIAFYYNKIFIKRTTLVLLNVMLLN